MENRIKYFCDPSSIEENAKTQLDLFDDDRIKSVAVFPDIHYCSEKNLPVGVSFVTTDVFFPLVTGKDIGCGVMFLRISKSDYLKPFNKAEHYRAFDKASYTMTDDGLGGGNHFLSIEDGDDGNIYIICHTGSRNLGIAMYQKFLRLIDEHNAETGSAGTWLPKKAFTFELWSEYQGVLRFAEGRRKQFVLSTLMFLQRNGYVRSGTSDPSKLDLRSLPNDGLFNGVNYTIMDSMHNHIRYAENISHRKGATEIWGPRGHQVVIPLSMTRGSLIVTANEKMKDMLNEANWSCSHGAGRALSRIDAMRHWKSGMKASERKRYEENFPELLDRNGEFPKGYIQEFDFAYKNSDDILASQPYLIKVAKTTPIATVKFTEI